jgi:hypothetical protein
MEVAELRFEFSDASLRGTAELAVDDDVLHRSLGRRPGMMFCATEAYIAAYVSTSPGREVSLVVPSMLV